MKVRYKNETDKLILTQDKIYDVLSIERGWYRVIVDFGEDYLFPAELFEVVEGGPEDLPEDKPENWWRGGKPRGMR